MPKLKNPLTTAAVDSKVPLIARVPASKGKTLLKVAGAGLAVATAAKAAWCIYKDDLSKWWGPVQDKHEFLLDTVGSIKGSIARLAHGQADQAEELGYMTRQLEVLTQSVNGIESPMKLKQLKQSR